MFFWDCPQPQKQFEVRKCGRSEWTKFRKYHYLSSDLSTAAVCYGLFDNDDIIGFCGVLHQPHSKNKMLKRVSRLVILPDYQGIGLATKFLDVIARHYTKQGFTFTIVTSAKNMIYALHKSSKWKMTRWSVNKTNNAKSKIDYRRKSARTDCKTGGFRYIGQ